MAKKDFKDVTQSFFTQPAKQAKQAGETQAKQVQAKKAGKASVSKKQVKPVRTAPVKQPVSVRTAPDAKTITIDYSRKEKKDKRVQLVLKPSLFNALKQKLDQISTEVGKPVSLNDYVHQLLEKVVSNENN